MTTETSSTGARVPLLELKNISKFFGNVTALQDVSTKVHAGAVTCVLGDNGAGKSTFIKILVRPAQAERGRVPDRRRAGRVRVAA